MQIIQNNVYIERSIDDSEILEALVIAKNKGMTIHLPSNEAVQFGGVPWVVEGCTIKGAGSFKLANYQCGGFVHSRDENSEIISLKSGGVVNGVGFYYPDQSTGLDPIAYPPTIKLNNKPHSANNIIKNNMFVNSYVGIDLNGTSTAINALTTIEKNRFCCISKSINHPYSLTECIIKDNYSSYVFWQESLNKEVRNLINKSSIFLDLADCDGTIICNNMLYGVGVFVRLTSTPALTTIANNMIDGVYRGILLDKALINAGTINSTGNTYTCKDARSGATDAAAIYGHFDSGIVGGTFNSFGDIFSHTDGNHIDIETTATADSNYMRLNINSQFVSPGRNDPSNDHYGIRIIDKTKKMTVKIDGLFDDPVNKVTTGVYLDGVKTAKISGVFNSIKTGIKTRNVKNLKVDALFADVPIEQDIL